MKARTSHRPVRHSPEFKGVVKKITGKLTNRPELEREGRAEMLGRASPGSRRHSQKKRRTRLNPDPHRRG